MRRKARPITLIAMAFGLLLAVIVGDIAFRYATAVRSLRTRYPVVHLPEGKITIEKARPRGWTDLSAISRVGVAAIMISEDWAFYRHKGFDLKQIRNSVETNWEEKRFARGASTITQQVVRNVFLSKEKTLWRKAREAVLTLVMEATLPKRRILEIYLNIAEWGPDVYGIGRASRYYFSKSPSELRAKEGAFLAMLLPNPKEYSRSFRAGDLTPYASKIVRSILGKLVQAGYLTAEEAAQEWREPLPFEPWEIPQLFSDPGDPGAY